MFKDNFERLLQERGISALQLARETGIPKSVVYEWRKGERLPSAENLAKLSRYFGVSLDEIMGELSVFLSGEERDLIMLLREASKVSGEQREKIMDELKRGMEKYLSESGTGKNTAVRKRGGKKSSPDSQ